MKTIKKHLEGEYAPYTIKYIGLLPNNRRLLEHLKNNFKEVKKNNFILTGRKIILTLCKRQVDN